MGDIKVSGPNAFTFANNFKIHGGDVSAVGGNQTVSKLASNISDPNDNN